MPNASGGMGVPRWLKQKQSSAPVAEVEQPLPQQPPSSPPSCPSGSGKGGGGKGKGKNGGGGGGGNANGSNKGKEKEKEVALVVSKNESGGAIQQPASPAPSDDGKTSSGGNGKGSPKNQETHSSSPVPTTLDRAATRKGAVSPPPVSN